APARRDLVAVTDETWQGMATLAQSLPLPTILQAQQRLRESEVQVKSSTQPRLWLEVALMGLLPSSLTLLTATVGEGAVPRPASSATDKPAYKRADEPLPDSATPEARPKPLHSDAPPAASPPAAPLSKPRTAPEARPAPAAAAPSREAEPKSAVPAKPPTVTTAAAAAPESQPTPDTPPAPPQVDLAQTWQEVLQHLRPPGIQALLDQHGHLMQFDGRVARVGIVSSPLMKIAEQRVKNVELAFDAALKAQVSVTFQVTGQTSAPQPSASSATAPLASQPSGPPSGPPSGSPSGLPSSPPLPPSSQQQGKQRPAPSSLDSPSASPASSERSPQIVSASDRPAPPPPPPLDDDSAVRAAKSFAEMFNGQVIDWNEDSELLPVSDSRGSTETAEQPEVPLENGRPDIDVPF
ncbi:MAG: hypothetical protein WBA10_02385, partial [Elainellaceae cyanobacterium]